MDILICGVLAPGADIGAVKCRGVKFLLFGNSVKISADDVESIKSAVKALALSMVFKFVDIDSLILNDHISRDDFCSLWLRGKEDFLESVLLEHDFRGCLGAMPWRRVGLSSTEKQLKNIVDTYDKCFKCPVIELCGFSSLLSAPAQRYRK